jgi:hypothetical protein
VAASLAASATVSGMVWVAVWPMVSVVAMRSVSATALAARR